MFMKSWRQWWLGTHRAGRKGSQQKSASRSRTSERFRPLLEALETRLTPSIDAYVVVSGHTADNTDSNIHGGSGTAGDPFQMFSLRGAILHANEFSTSAVIMVTAGTYNLSVNNPGTAVSGTLALPDLEVGSHVLRTAVIEWTGSGPLPVIKETVVNNDVFTTGFDSDLATPVAVNLTLDHLDISGGTFTGVFLGVDNATGRSDSTVSNCNIHDNTNTDPFIQGFGQGGGIQDDGGNLAVSNSIFNNNKATTTNSGNGGAIFYNDSNNALGNLSIANSTFTNNVAAANNGVGGGAVWIGVGNAGNTIIISGSTFSGNKTTNGTDGGALAIDDVSATVTVSDCAFTGNSVSGSGHGGAIDNNGSTSTLNLNFNRVVGNTAATATLGNQVFNNAGTLNGNDNWWGQNSGPAANDAVSSGGTFTHSRWLQLLGSAVPSAVNVGATSNVLAALNGRNSGGSAALSSLVGMPTFPAAGTVFSNAVKGTIPATTIQFVDGQASVVFTGTTQGNGSVNATADNQTVTIMITVLGLPTANAQSVNVNHDTAKGITLTGSDPNTPPQTPFTFTLFGPGPAHGSLSGFNSSTGAVTYTPNTGFHASDTFQFTVTNQNNGTSSPATVSLSVASDTPVANPQTVPVAHNTATAVTLTGTDGDDSPPLSLTFSNGNPAHGTLSGAAPNLTYTPNAGFAGTDSFTFTVSNGTNTSSVATVTLNVDAAVPTANPQTLSTNENVPLPVALTGSDSNSPPQTLSFAIATPPAANTGFLGALNTSTGSVTFTPANNFSGLTSFTFTVSNSPGGKTSAAATISINVNAVQANVSTVAVSWGTVGNIALVTQGDGLRLLPAGRSTDVPFLNINSIQITLSAAATLSPSDVSVIGIKVADYGPVTITGSGTSFTITLATPIAQADRVTVTIGNAGIATYMRRLDVLPGDVNDDGVVNSQDVVLVRNNIGIAGMIFFDINGDGKTDTNDYNLARRFIGTRLP